LILICNLPLIFLLSLILDLLPLLFLKTANAQPNLKIGIHEGIHQHLGRATLPGKILDLFYLLVVEIGDDLGDLEEVLFEQAPGRRRVGEEAGEERRFVPMQVFRQVDCSLKRKGQLWILFASFRVQESSFTRLHV
jgi:hypothetical protein